MSRNIRFRAWIHYEKIMVPIERLYIPINSKSVVIGASNEDRTIGVNHKDHEKEIEVMQYTGIQDKNGKDIYEGDIMRNIKNGDISTVKWHGSFGGYILSKLREPNKVNREWGELFLCYMYNEVIGNIYENPELIKS